uniref:Uncharacterized protein n=1 Tax=Amazona collaria TaxID=241587 RepID=A0A8B9EYK0_9PSIT
MEALNTVQGARDFIYSLHSTERSCLLRELHRFESIAIAQEKLEIAPPSPGQLKHGKRRMFVECGSVLVQSVFRIASSFSYKCWSVLIAVVWSNRKPKRAPTATLPPLFHNTSAGECAPFSKSRTESPKESALFKARSKHWFSKPSSFDAAEPCGVFVFETIDLLLVTCILNGLRSGIKLQTNWR